MQSLLSEGDVTVSSGFFFRPFIFRNIFPALNLPTVDMGEKGENETVTKMFLCTKYIKCILVNYICLSRVSTVIL